jgi:hypothetical protein
VSALEQRLVALGRELELPAEPDVAPVVLRRLKGRRPFPWRPVALVFAFAVIAVGTAFAVPQARSAILRFFHLGGASVVRVETLPQAVERSMAGGLGEPLPRSEAERRVGFELLLPPVRGDGPKRVYVLGSSLASVLLHADGRPVVFSEFSSQAGLLRKLVSENASVEPVRVAAGAPGLWVQGAPHVLTYFDRDLGFQQRPILIHGNVLLWTRGPLTLRLEGRLTKAQALELARHVG